MQAVESCAGVVDHGADVGRAAGVATGEPRLPAAGRLPLSLRTPRSASSRAGRRRSDSRGVLTGLLDCRPDRSRRVGPLGAPSPTWTFLVRHVTPSRRCSYGGCRLDWWSAGQTMLQGTELCQEERFRPVIISRLAIEVGLMQFGTSLTPPF